ncbi:MAG TPA: flagellar biosynthetic protein FliO, partial [Candidatus Obscuribacterales bacterium]
AEQHASDIVSLSLVLDVFLKLGIVLLLIYLSLRLLRRYGQQAPVLPGKGLEGKLGKWLTPWLVQPPDGMAVRTLQVHPLNRQVTLYLLEVEARRLLLSVSGQQVQLLGEWPADRAADRPLDRPLDRPHDPPSESEES